jgi:hypothetical protein
MGFCHVPDWTKIKLLVNPPAGNPVQQLRMSYEELCRRSTRRTMLVEPLDPRLFRIREPSLICGFSHRDVIEAMPVAGDAWRFTQVLVKSLCRFFLCPELLCPIPYLDGKTNLSLNLDDLRCGGMVVR